jgi:hypothetical protein
VPVFLNDKSISVILCIGAGKKENQDEKKKRSYYDILHFKRWLQVAHNVLQLSEVRAFNFLSLHLLPAVE